MSSIQATTSADSNGSLRGLCCDYVTLSIHEVDEVVTIFAALQKSHGDVVLLIAIDRDFGRLG